MSLFRRFPHHTQATQHHAPHISWTLQEPRWDLGMKTHILGDGVAAMMLASRADELPQHEVSIVHPQGAPMAEITCSVLEHGWTRIGCCMFQNVMVEVGSHNGYWQEHHAFREACLHIMHKANYLQNCREIAERNGVAFIEENHIKDEEEHKHSIHDHLVQARMRCCSTFLDRRLKSTSLFLMLQQQS